jgi:hypothetical protein
VNKQINAVANSTNANPSWIQESNFIEISLDQVIAELERQYDIKIKSDGVDTTKLFTGSFTQ